MAAQPKNTQNTKKSYHTKKVFFVGGLFVLLVLSILSSLRLVLNDLIYPQIYISGQNVSFLNREQAIEKLKTHFNQKLQNKKLALKNQSQSFEVSIEGIQNSIKLHPALDQAMEYGHKKFYFQPVYLNVDFEFDQNTLEQINNIAGQIDIQPIDSQLKIVSNQINVTPSQDGYVLDQQALKQSLAKYLNQPQGEGLELELPIKKSPPKLSYQDALEIKKRLDQIKLNPLKLTFEDQIFIMDLEKILNIIDLQNSESSLFASNLAGNSFNIHSIKFGQTEIYDTKLNIDQQQLEEYLKSIATQINQPVQEPLLSFDGQKIVEFKPPQNGQNLDIKKTAEKINLALSTPNQNEVGLVVNISQPKNKLTNDLGIKELVGEGVSNFAGSIENRIYNIRHGASKVNGVLIPPGEIFSFNKTVGDITAATGFKQAYVIKSGRTVLDDGGGICQVSTTIFRAALNAGLPIVQRTAHAYRVSYYEQGFPPGLDATIFYPSVDFQFKNDTNAHILIQSQVVGTTLYIRFYGTGDGRTVSLSRPVITSQTPAPPELRQDDPTLPKGTIKQVDWAAAGANVVFTRKVTRAGQEIINESFKSNYRPWQAVYLVGTKEN